MKKRLKLLSIQRKGFTLIELLAVIIILAILALIAVPIILNIIGDAKEESTELSKELYLRAVEQAVARENLDKNFNPTTCKVQKDGKLLCKLGEKEVELEVEVNGTKPNGGTITLKDGKVTDETLAYGNTTKPPSEIQGSESFAEDDWSTIITNVQSGNTDNYNVGDEKEITLTGFGTFTVRIANKSTPAECNQDGFSQSACGFVIEFKDIITTYNMNLMDSNYGGWEYCEMRKYLNVIEIEEGSGSIFKGFPKELQEAIINTTVISGYGSRDYENFKTTDKLYLLSTMEVWGSNPGGYDTVENETRQLDYYKKEGVTIDDSMYEQIIKQYKGVNTAWWLRSPYTTYSSDFYDVETSAGWHASTADKTLGVAPAFRLG